MIQNVIYSPWDRTKGPWLCLTTTLLLLSLLRLFSLFSHVLISLIKLILWLKFSTYKRQAEDMEGRQGARTTGSCSVSTATRKLKDACSLEVKLWQHTQCIKKQRHHFADICLYSQNYGFSHSHVCMWELGHKEVWALKSWCFWIVVLEKTLVLDSLGLQDQISQS